MDRDNLKLTIDDIYPFNSCDASSFFIKSGRTV